MDGGDVVEIRSSVALPTEQQQSSSVALPTEQPEPSGRSHSATNTTPSLTTENTDLIYTRDDRRYRIRGLEKNNSLLQLRVSLMVSRDSLCHLDVLDLTKARSRISFIKATATELYVEADTIKKDIGQLLMELETYQAERIAQLKTPKTVSVELSEAEEQAALELLQDPSLLQRITADIATCGMVGETSNTLAGYLAATSRKLPTPLAVIIQSSSSAGKTSLMDAVLAMMPPEDVQRFSGITGQSLYYLDSDKIKHKILAISEDEGIGEAAYALKLLQSEGELRHATVSRGEDGQAQTREHHVEGPVQVFLTTTAVEVDEELANRCLVLAVDETLDQTSAIQLRQRESLTADFTRSSIMAEQIRVLHQNAQRLLQPIRIINPYASQLTFPNYKTRMRRDQMKYLTLISTITFLHQHQRKLRPIETATGPIDSIEVTPNDIAVANGLAGEILGRSLDELSSQTRRLLEKLHAYVAQQSKATKVPRDAFRFTRREVRQFSGLSHSQLSVHLQRLTELEYVLAHRGRNGQRYVYELLYSGEGREGQPFLMGLIDPSKLKEPAPMTPTFRCLEATFRPAEAT